MEVKTRRIGLTGLTIELNQNDLYNLGEWVKLLHSATKQDAYGIVKDLAGVLQSLIDQIIDDLPNTNNECENSHEEDGGNHRSSKKRPKDKNKEVDVANNELVKVSINNMDDNCVLHAAISILGEFITNNTIPVEAYIKQNKGVYVTEEQLDKLLDKLLAYNIKHPNKPLSVTIGE